MVSCDDSPWPSGGGAVAGGGGRGVVHEEGPQPVWELDEPVAFLVRVGLGRVHIRTDLYLNLLVQATVKKITQPDVFETNIST